MGIKNKVILNILKVLWVICFLITVLLCIIYGTMYQIGEKVTYKQHQNVQYTENTLKDKNVENILVIGTDGRSNVSGNRSDMMMLVSINKKTNKIILTSFLRDCYVEIPGVGGNRLNSAFVYGGADLTVRTIETNFDIAIDHYIVVGFDVVIAAIDAMGGVKLSLEVDELNCYDPTKPVFNQYVNELNILEGLPVGTDFITEPGIYLLNGRQALSYARIRYTVGNDFSRTSRQREVILETLKQSNIRKLISAAKAALPMIETDFTPSEIADHSIYTLDYITYDMVELSIPQVNGYKDVTINNMAVLEVKFDKMHQLLKETIYTSK